MTTRFARVVRLSTALMSLTLVGAARAQAPVNPGRQIEGQVINNVSGAVTGQPATVAPGQAGVVPGQAGVVPGQAPGYVAPTTPGQALQGMQRQAINNATNAVTGQPGYTQSQTNSAMRYQLPQQYAASAPGTTVSYGGANYIVNADGTMSPAAAAAQPAGNAVRYQLPPQYAASSPGTTVSYGGANYVVNADRTMSPAAASAQPPANGVRYQLPPQFASAAPGTTVSYGGANYIVNADRTMSPAAAATQPAATQSAAIQPSPPATRYLIPAELAGNAAGAAINYGGTTYLINDDNTMSPATRRQAARPPG
jgi:hypothetical protein